MQRASFLKRHKVLFRNKVKRNFWAKQTRTFLNIARRNEMSFIESKKLRKIYGIYPEKLKIAKLMIWVPANASRILAPWRRIETKGEKEERVGGIYFITFLGNEKRKKKNSGRKKCQRLWKRKTLWFIREGDKKSETCVRGWYLDGFQFRHWPWLHATHSYVENPYACMSLSSKTLKIKREKCFFFFHPTFVPCRVVGTQWEKM